MKKFFSMLLAFTLIFGMNTAVFAADSNYDFRDDKLTETEYFNKIISIVI